MNRTRMITDLFFLIETYIFTLGNGMLTLQFSELCEILGSKNDFAKTLLVCQFQRYSWSIFSELTRFCRKAILVNQHYTLPLIMA